MKVRYETGPYVVVEVDDKLPEVLAEATRVGATKEFSGVLHYRLLFVGKDTYPKFYSATEMNVQVTDNTSGVRQRSIFDWIPIASK